MTGARDVWASGAQYEPFIGRWSRLVAREFVPWLGVSGGARWLDVGCGTGVLTDAILRTAAPASVLGVDPAVAFLEYARRHVVGGNAFGDAVRFVQGSAESLNVDAASFDAVVSGLVLNFVRDQRGALVEMKRGTVAGGVVAAYVWDYPGEMWYLRHFWDAAVQLDPNAVELHEGRRFSGCRPAELEALFIGAGLASVESRPIVVSMVFESFDDYWAPFLGGQGPAPSYLASLDTTHRQELREAVRGRVPASADGFISLTARAWAVRGRA